MEQLRVTRPGTTRLVVYLDDTDAGVVRDLAAHQDRSVSYILAGLIHGALGQAEQGPPAEMPSRGPSSGATTNLSSIPRKTPRIEPVRVASAPSLLPDGVIGESLPKTGRHILTGQPLGPGVTKTARLGKAALGVFDPDAPDPSGAA